MQIDDRWHAEIDVNDQPLLQCPLPISGRAWKKYFLAQRLRWFHHSFGQELAKGDRELLKSERLHIRILDGEKLLDGMTSSMICYIMAYHQHDRDESQDC